MESLYAALMFRTPVTKTVTATGITYGTSVLDGYAEAFRNVRERSLETFWRTGPQAAFPYERFVSKYRSELEALVKIPPPERSSRMDSVFITLLPLLAWHRAVLARRDDESLSGDPIKLALDLIAGYTDVL